MFGRLNKKAQSTAEYAILIAIVVGALVGMQIYVRRGIQGRIADVVDQGASLSVTNGTYTATANFTGRQFEPYYLATGGINQTTTGSTTKTGSTDTAIVSGESGYTTSRTGSRVSAGGLTLGGGTGTGTGTGTGGW